MRARYLGVVGVALVPLVAGCAGTIPQEQVATNEQFGRQIAELKRKDAGMDSLQVAVNRVESMLSAQDRRTEARLAEREKGYDSLGNAVALLGDQVAALEREVAALKAAPGPSPAMTQARAIETKYHLAHKACRDRDFPKALAGFNAVLREGPRHELADNAQYWVGECYYATGQFDQAIAEFKKVFAYPDTDKDDDAQLKIGFSYFQKGDKAQALVELNRLLADYPQSELIDDARSKIAQIEGM
jgi:tol-pal system protein YbgF